MCAYRTHPKLELGFRVHMLTVISEEIPARESLSNTLQYLTRCDCGNEVFRRKQDLVTGRLKSCGCLNNKDIIGQKFNKLLVLSEAGKEYRGSDGKKQLVRFLNCLCDCGNECIVRYASIKSTKSCGCARTESNRARIQDISGQRFSRLVAVRRCEETDKWICQCDCGEIQISKLASLRNGDSQSCGCLQKEHASRLMNEKHMERRKELGLDPYEMIVDRGRFNSMVPAVYSKDSFTCQLCSHKSSNLNAHHIIPWHISEELRHSFSNLVTLCKDCHKRVHKNNYHGPVDEHLTILLQGYTKLREEGFFNKAVRVELSPN